MPANCVGCQGMLAAATKVERRCGGLSGADVSVFSGLFMVPRSLFCSDAFSSREPEATSLENAPLSAHLREPAGTMLAHSVKRAHHDKSRRRIAGFSMRR